MIDALGKTGSCSNYSRFPATASDYRYASEIPPVG